MPLSPLHVMSGWQHYISDYATLALLWATVLFIHISGLHPWIRPFFPNDPSLAHPHLPDIVSTATALTVAYLVPFLASLFVSVGRLFLAHPPLVLSNPTSTHPAFVIHDFHHFTLGLLASASVTTLITDLLKLWCGRLRPDFLSRCQYNPEQGICTGDPASILEGRKSFPSGHASTAFAGLGFLSLWLALFLGIFHPDRHGLKWGLGIVARWTLILIPLLIAAYIAISRTQQYIHHVEDVVVGSLLGLGIAYLFFVSYYRTPSSPYAYLDGVPPTLDEEEGVVVTLGAAALDNYRRLEEGDASSLNQESQDPFASDFS